VRLHLARVDAALPADEDVVEDREQPRADVRAEAVLLPPLEGAQQRVGDEILGVVARAGEFEREAVERVEMLQRLALELARGARRAPPRSAAAGLRPASPGPATAPSTTSVGATTVSIGAAAWGTRASPAACRPPLPRSPNVAM
jgi:hypothetical protein